MGGNEASGNIPGLAWTLVSTADGCVQQGHQSRILLMINDCFVLVDQWCPAPLSLIVEWDNDVDLVGFLQTDNLTKDSNVSHPKCIILLPGGERRSSGLELWVCCQERMGGGVGTRDVRLLIWLD